MSEEVFWEKSGNERRIDHKQIFDVIGTKYVRAEIVEWDKEGKLSGDFVEQVKPLVKVEYGGGTTDYIPLFYKPKEGYWDWLRYDQDAQEWVECKSTEYDSDKHAYKSAWQSFRAGDEVLLVIIDDKPIAVLGHYDGCPRLGESLIKVHETIYKFGVAGFEVISGEEDYGLLKEADVIASNEYSYGGGSGEGWTTIVCSEESPCEYCDRYYTNGRVHIHMMVWGGGGKYVTDVFKVLVGPYIILVVAVGLIYESSGWQYDYYYSNYPSEPEEIYLCTESGSDPGGAYIVSLGFMVDIYDPKKHESIDIEWSGWYPLTPDGFVDYGSGGPDPPINSSKIKVYTRPHTKAELESAGLWPEVPDE